MAPVPGWKSDRNAGRYSAYLTAAANPPGLVCCAGSESTASPTQLQSLTNKTPLDVGDVAVVGLTADIQIEYNGAPSRQMQLRYKRR